MVISLTALTGGITPAFAKPDDQPVAPTTTVVAPAPDRGGGDQERRAPKQEAPKQEAPKQEAPKQQPPKQQAPKQQAPQQPQQVAPAPVVPQAPQKPQPQEPQTQAPQTQQPQQAPAVAPEPRTRTQAPPRTSAPPPVTSVEAAEPGQEPTTARRAPETSSEPGSAAKSQPSATSAAPGASKAPDSAEQEPQTSARTSGGSTGPSAALVPDSESETGKSPESSDREADTSKGASKSETAESETSKTAETPESLERSTSGKRESGEDESDTPTVSITKTAKELETIVPQTLEAPDEDVQLAKAAKPIVVEEQPEPATVEDLANFSREIETSLKIPGLDIGASAKTEFNVERRRDVELISHVRQWRRDWIEYDEYYRPIFLNPYRAPVRIVYVYDFRPRVVIIPPLARMVIEAARYAAYSFTAAVLAPINAAIDTAQAITNIAVGSFFGGGYFPGIGLPLPPPPPPVLRYDNVPVFVNYSNARYEPFRVRQIVDVGEDPRFGERKVLLDGATPAWGVWTETPDGERLFEVHRTQQFPGLDEPAEVPLPGDYKLKLLSDEAPDAGFTGRDIFLFVAAGVIGTLGLGAIGMAFYLGRRRPEH